MADSETPQELPEAVVASAEPDSGEKVAEKSPSPSPSPAGIPPHRLQAALKTTDILVHRLEKFISTGAGQDLTLAVTGYLSHTLHHLLASAPWIALQTRLSLLARLRQSGSAKSTPRKPSQSPLLALAALCSETRYTLRLFGSISLWTWASSTFKSPPADPVVRTLTYLQLFVNLLYQIFENGGYLAAKGIIPKRFIDRFGGVNKWLLYSIRAWGAHIFFQYILLWRQRTLQKEKMEDNERERKLRESRGEKVDLVREAAEEQEAMKAENRAWKKSLANSVFWTPLCIHWCFENGIGFPNELSGLFSFFAKAWGLKDMWAATAL